MIPIPAAVILGVAMLIFQASILIGLSRLPGEYRSPYRG